MTRVTLQFHLVLMIRSLKAARWAGPARIFAKCWRPRTVVRHHGGSGASQVGQEIANGADAAGFKASLVEMKDGERHKPWRRWNSWRKKSASCVRTAAPQW